MGSYTDKIYQIEKKTGTSSANWGKSEVLIFLQTNGGLSASSFYNARQRLLDALRETIDQESYDRISHIANDLKHSDVDKDQLFISKHFVSPTDLKSMLDLQVARLTNYSVSDREWYLFPMVALYCAWEGMKPSELINVEVEKTTEDGALISTTSGVYHFHSVFAPDIARFRELSIDKQYLFNTPRRDKITEWQLHNYYIHSLNKNSSAYNRIKLFKYDSVFDSGVFYRVKQKELKNGRFYHTTLSGKRKLIIDDFWRAANDFEVPGQENNLNLLYDRLKLYDIYDRVFFTQVDE